MVFSHSDNASVTALNNIMEAGGKVSWALQEFNLGGKSCPKGSFAVESGCISLDALRRISSETHIQMKRF